LDIKPQDERQLENFDIILKCVTHLIFLMLETAKSVDEKQTVKNLILNIVRINPCSAVINDSLLHLCVSRSNTIKAGYFLNDDPIVSIRYSFTKYRKVT